MSDTAESACPYHTTADTAGPETWPYGKKWDGAPGVWPRPTMLVPWYSSEGKLWRMPAQFIAATPDQALDCDEKRIDACYDNFLCTVCGDMISELGDGCGWLLGCSIIGGACCTRCAWLSLLSCPRLKEEGREVGVWVCRDKNGYRFQDPDRDLSVGHVVATEHATASSYAELEQAFRQLKQTADSGRCPARSAA